jgi:phosphoenolpyruvate carboxylase
MSLYQRPGGDESVPSQEDVIHEAPAAPVARKKAKQTKVQRDAAKENTVELWAIIKKEREDYRLKINEVADKFNRSALYVQFQL